MSTITPEQAQSGAVARYPCGWYSGISSLVIGALAPPSGTLAPSRSGLVDPCQLRPREGVKWFHFRAPPYE